MDSDKINELLQKYWLAETSLEEEQWLREFFARPHTGAPVPDSLQETATLFQYFEAQKKMGIDETSFEKNIRARITDSFVAGKGVIKKRMGGRFFDSPFGSQGFSYMARIAAGLLVVVAATFFIREEVRKAYPDEPEDTYSDPKMAFEETKKALMMISNSFGKVQKQASKINVFNEAQEKIHSPATIEKEVNEDEKKTNI